MPASFRPFGFRLRAVAVVAACAALGACVGVAVPKLPQGDLPAHWRNAPQLGTPPDLTGWWKQFHDPMLDALVDRALHDNLDVARAALQLRAARALEDATDTAYKPQLAFRTLEQPNPENTASYFQAGFDASWEFGLFGRSGANAHLAQAESGAALAELQSARVSLVAEVVREYLELRAAQRREALLGEAAEAARVRVDLTGVRARLRLASQLEVDEARAAEARSAAALADPRAAVVQHAQALALLVGKSEPDGAWLAPAPVPRLAAGNVTSVPADLLRTRPEIRYAETQVVKAAGEAGIARAELYPRLALGSSLTFSAQVTGHTRLGDVNNTFSIGPIIDIPLFDWKRRKSIKNAREDQLDAAVLAYRQAVLAGAAEVESSLASLHAAGARAGHADDAAAASQASLAASRRLEGLGEADKLQVAGARLAFVDSEMDRSQARLAQGLAFVALYKALGGAPLPAEPRDDAGAPASAVQPGAAAPAAGPVASGNR